ncbi:hypothetical protein KSF78_0008698 [Schistosoma japonicum]|nr:hypothetical protein KSF78_0008698 [Schistosoma japonicum]KAH8857758.1 hypothetical protein KSF78_0008698 [Schistosoma japonicum]
MGAEQSVGQQKSRDLTKYSQRQSFQSTRGTGHSSSLPSSPQYDWRRSSCGTSYSHDNNYGSMQISSNKKQQRSSISTSLKDTSLSKSSSTTLKKPGILTVNSGRRTSTSHYDLRSGGDVYCGSNINNNDSTEFGQIALKKLQRIPTFEPILSSAKIPGHLTSTTNQPIALNSQSIQLPSSSSTTAVTSTSFIRKKQFIPNLPEFDCEEIDRDISQLVNILQSREKGINVIHHSTSSTFLNSFNSPKKDNVNTHSIHDSMKLSGSQQIESIVLLSSQISGLLTQCNELSNQLMNSINNLNEILPD